MEIAPSPITFCSKEHQKIYREWFDIADSGSSSSLKRGVLLGISLNFNIIDYFVYRWRWPYHWKRCYKVLSSFKTFSARTQAGFNFRTLLLLNLFFFPYFACSWLFYLSKIISILQNIRLFRNFLLLFVRFFVFPLI